MDPGRRYFTLETATAVLPDVMRLLSAAMEGKSARAKSATDLAAYKKRLVMAGGAFPNKNRLAAYADQARTSHDAMKSAVHHLEALGLEVRDIEQGLVDFPALYQSQVVYLCYRSGEPTLAHWHYEAEPFSARRPITPEFSSQLDASFPI